MSSILVIDDDFNITRTVRKILSAENHQVQIANSGQDGLILLRENLFDVVITDIIMPDMDGIEVIMHINSMPVRPKVIVITGGSVYLDSELIDKVAKAMKVHQVLYKPFSYDELRSGLLA